MAQTVPTREPSMVVAGDTIAWRKTLPDYPAGAGWLLKYRLINAAGKIDITAGADGDDHLVGVPASISTDYPAGAYAWQAFVEKSGERYTIGQGSIGIAADLSKQAGGYETRSSAKQTLDQLDAAMVAHGPNAWTQEYEIAGRRMKFRNPVEFLGMRDKLKAEVAREEAAARLAAGLPGRAKVYVRF